MKRAKLLHELGNLLERQARVVHSMMVNEDAPVWDSEWNVELTQKYNALETRIKGLKQELGL